MVKWSKSWKSDCCSIVNWTAIEQRERFSCKLSCFHNLFFCSTPDRNNGWYLFVNMSFVGVQWQKSSCWKVNISNLSLFSILIECGSWFFLDYFDGEVRIFRMSDARCWKCDDYDLVPICVCYAGFRLSRSGLQSVRNKKK